MVNALKKCFSPLPAGKYGKSAEWSTQRRHQANERNSGLEAERVWALGALPRLRSNTKFAAETRQEKHFVTYGENV